MKIRDITAVGLRDATPESGWSEELHKVGFDGCVNPDHIPTLEGDHGNTSLGLAYSIGYIKALLAALAA